MTGWMDTHCHFSLLKEAQGTAESVWQRAKAQQVTRILDVATGADNWDKVIDHAQRFDGVYAGVGVHPTNEAETIDWDQLTTLAQRPRVIAIGECGLDFYHEPEFACQHQYERFERQIELARQTNKPLIIHTRNSAQQTLEVLRKYKGEVIGIMHCFVEDESIAQQALDIGFYLSFSGIVTFKNATQVQRVAQWAPADRILIETDSPYLAPVPHRGQQNEPAFVANVGQYLAKLRQVNESDLMTQLNANAQTLFGAHLSD
jgi:TatD DNase family protein